MSDEQSLADEFNKSAASWASEAYDTNVTTDLLLMKYEAMQRYKIGDNGAKKELTLGLYNAATSIIGRRSGVPASNSVYFPEEQCKDLTRIFDAVLREGEAKNLPATAPQELASLSLDLIRKTETLDPKQFKDHHGYPDHNRITAYRNGATALAGLTLQYAEKLREAITQVTGNVTTSQPLSASRPIQLKAAAGAQTP
jgi:hypothetical protein